MGAEDRAEGGGESRRWGEHDGGENQRRQEHGVLETVISLPQRGNNQ
jgi:hypothetical protein